MRCTDLAKSLAHRAGSLSSAMFTKPFRNDPQLALFYNLAHIMGRQSISLQQQAKQSSVSPLASRILMRFLGVDGQPHSLRIAILWNVWRISATTGVGTRYMSSTHKLN